MVNSIISNSNVYFNYDLDGDTIFQDAIEHTDQSTAEHDFTFLSAAVPVGTFIPPDYPYKFRSDYCQLCTQLILSPNAAPPNILNIQYVLCARHSKGRGKDGAQIETIAARKTRLKANKLFCQICGSENMSGRYKFVGPEAILMCSSHAQQYYTDPHHLSENYRIKYHTLEEARDATEEAVRRLSS